MEPVYVRNTIKKVWEPGVVLNRPNPVREPRTYTVNVNGKVYYHTREHLKPRSNLPEEIVDTSKDQPRITTAVASPPTIIPQASNTTPPTHKNYYTQDTESTTYSSQSQKSS